MNLHTLHQALAEARYETARRIGLKLLSETATPSADLLFTLHDALVPLADFHAARALLETHASVLEPHAFQTQLRLATDFQKLTGSDHYRISSEASQGFTLDEYQEKYRHLATESARQARTLARTPEDHAAVDACEKGSRPQPFTAPSPFRIQPAPKPSPGGIVSGTILLENGKPAAEVDVTLGLENSVSEADPATFISHAMHYFPVIAPLSKLTTQTDAQGHFTFTGVPAGTHPFLAVTLPPEKHAIATRFLARNIGVSDNATAEFGILHATAWQSAPAIEHISSHPDILIQEGVRWTKVTEWKLHNPFHYEFPRQLLQLTPPSSSPGTIKVCIQPGVEEPHQLVQGDVTLLTGLAPLENKVIALYHSTETKTSLTPQPATRLIRDSGNHWILDTGIAAFRIAGENAPIDASPLSAVRGPDRVWRGNGRFQLPAASTLIHRTTTVLEEGPLLVRVEISYQLNTGASWSVQLTALAGEPLLLVHERSSALEGAAFEFSLQEFTKGRGFLHWTPELSSRHWTTLDAQDTVVAQLPESVPWWIPPQGFAYAMTAEGLDHQDYIAVFTRRRGEWIDSAFERIAQGPIDETGKENRELEWPYPEMVGSTLSMITAHTTKDSDAFFRFNFFDGERQWGILASAFAENDGPFKQLGRLQHAYSSLRLQEFKDWHFDIPDSHQRPHVVASRDELPALRRKTQSRRFSGLWQKIRSENVPGVKDGLLFAMDGDPLVAWHKRTQLLSIAAIRSKMTLLGRDFSDTYSPVGGRTITKWAEEYDLIAASGVFTPEEERLVRAFFILMGHLYMEEDFMNWRFNGRNANFEADRTDIVAAIGLVFHGHPDSPKFLNHVIERTRKALTAYCTPGSGKWYENPACYYLHASKCRMNLVYHLAHKGLIELDDIPRLKDFLRWGLHLLTPPQPIPYDILHRGDAAAYQTAPKVRKVPPIGDHAGIGRWLPEHYAFIGKLFLKSDPVFGRQLINAYLASNGDGQRLLGLAPWTPSNPEATPVLPPDTLRNLTQDSTDESLITASTFGNLPLLFASFDENDIPNQQDCIPFSRRLEGFGAVFRNKVNSPDESYLLIKQGPGGYRFHRTEGSFLYFAHGVPLVYDGGEAGETWRHSTLSFHDVHMPLSPGRVERYLDLPGLQFVQGVHPVILQPGEPVFLNDSCRHELVTECYRRYHLEPPANVRSFLWIDDEYLIIHDDLSASMPALSHWHLQVVGHPLELPEENRFRFTGRFGIDLEVQLPGQSFDARHCAPLPITHHLGTPDLWFTMQHVQLTRRQASHYLAVLRPLPSGNSSRFDTESLADGHAVRIQHESGTDHHWFKRSGLKWTDDRISFTGSFGSLRETTHGQYLTLMGPGELKTPAARLVSRGPAVRLRIEGDHTTVETDDEKNVSVELASSHT